MSYDIRVPSYGDNPVVRLDQDGNKISKISYVGSVEKATS